MPSRTAPVKLVAVAPNDPMRYALAMNARLASLTTSLCAAFVAACSPTPRPTVLEASTTASSREKKADGTPVDDPTAVDPEAVTTPALGAVEPLVVVTIFTDYQCPNCKRMHDLAARLVDRWPDEVQVQFRQVPLAIHPLARQAANAALAAHRQGRFACMHAALVRSRLDWTGFDAPHFDRFLEEVLVPHCGLDAARFARDLVDPRIATKVQEDWKLAGDAEVPGTPTVLVDGLRARLWPRAGVEPQLLLNALVRRNLREAREQLAHGTKRIELPALRLYGNTGNEELTLRLLDAER